MFRKKEPPPQKLAPISFSRSMVDAGSDLTKALVEELAKRAIKTTSDSVVAIVAQELAKTAAGALGRALIEAWLRYTDETSEKLSQLERRVDFLYAEPLLTGLRLAKQAFAMEPDDESELRRREVLLDDCRRQFESVLTLYQGEGITTSDLLDLQYLIAICHCQVPGGKRLGQAILSECASDVHALADAAAECNRHFIWSTDRVHFYNSPTTVAHELYKNRKMKYVDLVIANLTDSMAQSIIGNFIPPDNAGPDRCIHYKNEEDMAWSKAFFDNNPEQTSFYAYRRERMKYLKPGDYKKERELDLASGDEWWRQRIARLRAFAALIANSANVQGLQLIPRDSLLRGEP